MKIDPVTSRYAEALYGLAGRSGELDAVRADVERLAALLARPGSIEVVFHPGKDAATRKGFLAEALAGATQTFRNFVDLCFEKRRDVVLRDLGEAFRQRDLAAAGVVEGVVTSARPLASGELAELTVGLGAKLGKEVRLKNEIDPALIAGVRVHVDHRMVDNSVAGRFDGLRRRMTDAALPSAGS